MRQPRRKSSGNAGHGPRGGQAKPVGVRIIAGQFRGRKLLYAVDPRTRPMKDRVRQALFSRLGPAVQGTLAIDLFAGTGALGFEALSRGAARAVLVEQHVPIARAIGRNAEMLGAERAVEVVTADAFHWFRTIQAGRSPMPWSGPANPAQGGGLSPAPVALGRIGQTAVPPGPGPAGPDAFRRPSPVGRRLPGPWPWLVFCSPPYDFFVERAEQMLDFIAGLLHAAPAQSVLVVESDRRFEFCRLPNPEQWDVRAYPPTLVGIYWKSATPDRTCNS